VGDAAQRVSRSQERLSSFLRINRAADDAAGLAIAERFQTQVRELDTEVGGFQSGINLADTAEGGLSSQADIVGRIRELATQASNGLLNDDQRAAINEEAQQLIQEVDNISTNTTFNGVQPLDGSTGTITLDVQGSVALNLPESSAVSLGLDSLDLTTQAGASAALGATDNAQAQINTNRATLGAQANRVESAIQTNQIESENLQASESALRDLDVAREFIEQTRSQVQLQASLGALAQGNLNSRNVSSLLGR
jgi:flagellin